MSDIGTEQSEEKPKAKQEILQYEGQQLALSITGEQGTSFDFEKHKYDPGQPLNEGIIRTKSGNDYYIITDPKGTYIVNTRETINSGKLVAAHSTERPKLPPIQFGRPWQLPGFFTTSDVESVLLKYKIGDIGEKKLSQPSPFDKYRTLLRKHGGI